MRRDLIPLAVRALRHGSLVEGLDVELEGLRAGLEAAREHGLVQRIRSLPGAQRWGLTARGRRWLAEPWPLLRMRDVAELRRRLVAGARDEIDTAEAAMVLGVTRRRVAQILRETDPAIVRDGRE